MPAGLVNALASRQQFLDLVRYLMEIAEDGPARARALRPDPALARASVARLRARLDHAGLIAGLGPEALQRGEAIYNRVCANCHGTKDQPGSLPTAPRFASGDAQERQRPLPHVSHAHRRLRPDGAADLDGPSAEVRRDPLHPRGVSSRPHNPLQYARVDRAYLDRLPKGTTPRARAVGDRALESRWITARA